MNKWISNENTKMKTMFYFFYDFFLKRIKNEHISTGFFFLVYRSSIRSRSLDI